MWLCLVMFNIWLLKYNFQENFFLLPPKTSLSNKIFRVFSFCSFQTTEMFLRLYEKERKNQAALIQFSRYSEKRSPYSTLMQSYCVFAFELKQRLGKAIAEQNWSQTKSFFDQRPTWKFFDVLTSIALKRLGTWAVALKVSFKSIHADVGKQNFSSRLSDVFRSIIRSVVASRSKYCVRWPNISFVSVLENQLTSRALVFHLFIIYLSLARDQSSFLCRSIRK